MILLGVLVLATVPAFAAVPVLSLGKAVVSGSTVTFPVTLANVPGTSISGITTDIGFDPNSFDLIMDAAGAKPASAVIGVAATTAGKQLLQSTPAAGVLRILIFSIIGTTPIPDGTVAQISFTIKAGGAAGNETFTNIPSATGPNGNNLAISGTGTTIAVDPPPAAVNGVCGSANNSVVDAAPTTNLCLTGTPSTVAGTGPWTWSCAGLNGGSTAPCSANLLIVPTEIAWAIKPVALSVNYKAAKGVVSAQATVTAGSATNAAIQAVSTVPWIQIVSDNGTEIALKNGKGGGKIAYTVAANPASTSRTGAITINGVEMPVTQAKAPCVISSVSPSKVSATATGGSYTLNVSAPDSCNWSVTVPTTATWLKLDSSPLTGSGSGVFTLTVKANSATADSNGKLTSRNAKVLIQAESGARKTVSVQQSATQ